ncbi:type II toxin-antitoxin system PemK/MazF family toxin [Caulobacter sp. LARHSG274]
MAIKEHPPIGSLLMCDFGSGFREPEMVKRRPVVVVSPKIAARPGLCTVVALSTTPPAPPMAYHCQIDIRPELPDWMQSDGVWVKGDMISSVGFHRLDFIRTGKAVDGRRQYYYSRISAQHLGKVRACILNGIGLSHLTKHL